MRPNCICGPDLQEQLCSKAVAQALAAGATSPILKRPVEFLVEEFRWLAQHGITTASDYVAAERVGRAGTRIARADRSAVFDIYERYRRLRTARNKDYDWWDLSHAVLEELEDDAQPRLYRHVVIDEGQDFSPTMLRSLAAVIPEDGSLTFFGDMAQQIYGNKMSWRSAGLQLGGREIWHFEENYRNTRQIARLALALADRPDFPDDPDLVEPKSPTADGPLPAMVFFASEREEIEFVANQAARRAKTETVAVLFRDRDLEGTIRGFWQESATRLHRQLNRWPLQSALHEGHRGELDLDGVRRARVSDCCVPLKNVLHGSARGRPRFVGAARCNAGNARRRADPLPTWHYSRGTGSFCPANGARESAASTACRC